MTGFPWETIALLLLYIVVDIPLWIRELRKVKEMQAARGRKYTCTGFDRIAHEPINKEYLDE